MFSWVQVQVYKILFQFVQVWHFCFTLSRGLLFFRTEGRRCVSLRRVEQQKQLWNIAWQWCQILSLAVD